VLFVISYYAKLHHRHLIRRWPLSRSTRESSSSCSFQGSARRTAAGLSQHRRRRGWGRDDALPQSWTVQYRMVNPQRGEPRSHDRRCDHGPTPPARRVGDPIDSSAIGIVRGRLNLVRTPSHPRRARTDDTHSLERRWSSRTFRYGYLVTTSSPLPSIP